MSHRNHHIFPHPVLSPQRQDYESQYSFEVLTPHTVLFRMGQNINIRLKYQLQSNCLRNLIVENRATYMAVIECSRTYQRRSFPSCAEENDLMLNRSEWQGNLHLTPYVATTTEIPGFGTPEHSSMIRRLAPQGIDLPAGAILAVGNIIAIDLEEESAIQSIFDIVPDRGREKGTFSTELSGERIAINIHPDSLENFQNIRRQSQFEPLLHQALYLHTLHKALLGLEDHTHRRWAQVLHRRLEAKGISISEELADNAELYAQQLFDLPFARMLDTLNQETDDE